MDLSGEESELISFPFGCSLRNFVVVVAEAFLVEANAFELVNDVGRIQVQLNESEPVRC